jgi:predicted xylose isomerase-like sugar epimerase
MVYKRYFAVNQFGIYKKQNRVVHRTLHLFHLESEKIFPAAGRISENLSLDVHISTAPNTTVESEHLKEKKRRVRS